MAFMAPHRSESGQMLLIAVLLGLVLLICIPAIIFVNHSASHQQVASLQANKAESTAVHGISYTVQKLSPDAVWKGALTAGFFPAGTGCNAITPLTTPSGEPFTLTCDQSGRPYEIHIVATSHAQKAGAPSMSSRSVEAYVSRRTVGVKLDSGYAASAAMVLVSTPSGVTDLTPLTVHWGPVVCLSSSTSAAAAWVLVDPMNKKNRADGTTVPGFPRKFSVGGITGEGSAPGDTLFRVPDWNSTAVTSDQKEFWVGAAQTTGPTLDDDGYQTLAKNTDPGPTSSVTQIPDAWVPGDQNKGFFSVPNGETIIFGAGFQPLAGSIIYVQGNAEMDDLALDLLTGAIIIKGNLTLNSLNGGDGKPGMALNLPPSSPLEYAYFGANDPWPCRTKVEPQYLPPYQCTVGNPEAAGLFANYPDRVHFRGFLWVQGDLWINNNWNMAGVIVVGDPSKPSGVLRMQTGGSLTLAYDDIVNHSILTASTELQSDVLRDIPSQ